MILPASLLLSLPGDRLAPGASGGDSFVRPLFPIRGRKP